LRFSVDIGGTFTDLVIEHDDGRIQLAKAPTVPADPVEGVLAAFDVAARANGVPRRELLAAGALFIHATTRAINAVLTGTTARTAFLTTEGHPDILSFAEGGRTEQFNHTRRYPKPYVPRPLTFEVPERITVTGDVLRPLDEARFAEIIDELRRHEIEAVAVCLLWSIVNPAHEQRVAELLSEHLPGVPFTLSHALNPTMREYRRASSTCIDASLKPVVSEYLRDLAERIREAGFEGRVLMVASSGGVLGLDEVARSPIHALGSGPAMAPVAGRYFSRIESRMETAIVADAGGTSYDVSLVRDGRIPWTRESWVGERDLGFMTGFPSVDVRSIGAGGGSIGWVDDGGLLHVGPQSAGSVPGPACYGRGGTKATFTDASLSLGYIDPVYFLGGAMELDADLAREALERDVGAPLRLAGDESAAAVVRVVTERMVGAIEDITLRQGIDPGAAVLVGGGGAAGLNIVPIARRLHTPLVLVPEVSPSLSAAGALLSDLTRDFSAAHHTTTADFDFAGVGRVLDRLRRDCEAFAAGPGREAVDFSIELSVEARYPHQVWDLEIPLRRGRCESAADVDDLRDDFHTAHREVFSISDDRSEVEFLTWRGRVSCRLRDERLGVVTEMAAEAAPGRGSRDVYFLDSGWVRTRVVHLGAMQPGERVQGPVVLESPWTTIVVDPGAAGRVTAGRTLVIEPWADAVRAAVHSATQVKIESG
jgi:N-methylhydantoinase A